MKKKIGFSILVLSYFFQSILLAQCGPGTAGIDLEDNNIRARLNSSGRLWYDGLGGAHFAPDNSTPVISSIYSGNLWVAGLSPSGELKVSGGMQTEFSPGHNDNQVSCDNFDRFWEVRREDIDLHIDDFEDNGVIDGNTSISILEWPGKGNPVFESITGFFLPSKELAPFIDRNGDGIYNPLEGDYPDVKGTQNVWWIFSDNYNQPSTAVDLEVHAMAFSSGTSNQTINHTTFYEFKIINRASQSLNQAYASLWVDPDLGCPSDDYVGSHPATDLAYVYNADAIDGQSSCICPFSEDVSSYCEEIPLLGFKVLDASPSSTGENLGLSTFSYFANPGSIPQPPTMITEPSTNQEYYNYMKGLWKDGTPLTYGGNGYNPNSGNVTNFAFPDSPHSSSGWSMCSYNVMPSDYRILLNSGPSTIAPGGFIKLAYAVIWIPNIAHPCPSIVPMINAVNEVEDYYETVSTVGLSEQHSFIPASLSPNPMENQAVLTIAPKYRLEEVQIYNALGKLMQSYPSNGSNELVITKKDLSPGVYWCKVVTAAGKRASLKLVVQ